MDIANLFYSIQQDNPGLGSYACLLRAIKGSGCKRAACEFYFNEFVEKDDYFRADKSELIECLIRESAKQTD